MSSQSEPGKNERAANIALIAVFVGTIAAFFLLICFLPKHEGELSPNERRMLADAPDASFNNIISGGFADEVDSWLEDQFPGRNLFVAAYAYATRLIGRNPTESIILGAGDRLYTAPIEPDEERIRKNGETISTFAENNDLNTELVIIPACGYLYPDGLPKLHLEYSDGDIISAFENACMNEGCKNVSVEKLFSKYGDASEFYYRTDHHLTMNGSYAIYCALAERLGFSPISKDEFSVTGYEFHGTSYGVSGLMLTKPDTMEVWTSDDERDYAVITMDGGNMAEYTGMYDVSCLEDGFVDRYACYLYSNHGMTIIENSGLAEGTLLVLKDSYANAIVPFLARHYHRIIMIDTRYYSSVSAIPSELVSEYGIESFVVILGTDSVNSDLKIAYLR